MSKDKPLFEMFDERNERGESDVFWFDPVTGECGYGDTFGEHSSNGRPIGALYGEEAKRAFLQLNDYVESLNQYSADRRKKANEDPKLFVKEMVKSYESRPVSDVEANLRLFTAHILDEAFFEDLMQDDEPADELFTMLLEYLTYQMIIYRERLQGATDPREYQLNYELMERFVNVLFKPEDVKAAVIDYCERNAADCKQPWQESHGRCWGKMAEILKE